MPLSSYERNNRLHKGIEMDSTLLWKAIETDYRILFQKNNNDNNHINSSNSTMETDHYEKSMEDYLQSGNFPTAIPFGQNNNQQSFNSPTGGHSYLHTKNHPCQEKGSVNNSLCHPFYGYKNINKSNSCWLPDMDRSYRTHGLESEQNCNLKPNQVCQKLKGISIDSGKIEGGHPCYQAVNTNIPALKGSKQRVNKIRSLSIRFRKAQGPQNPNTVMHSNMQMVRYDIYMHMMPYLYFRLR